MITILGPTACGKTRYAVQIAAENNGEIISADSRQVFRRMNIGTGKDLDLYCYQGQSIPYHLIDICEPGDNYSVYQYVQDFGKVYTDIVDRGKQPIVCGGTGLYLSAILQGYDFVEVPIDAAFHEAMNQLEHAVLIERLKALRTTHNTTDFVDKPTTIRALEIAQAEAHRKHYSAQQKWHSAQVIGLTMQREKLCHCIEQRLNERLTNGLIEEVETLIRSGIEPQRLINYGLEYKFITQYLLMQLTYDEMATKLGIAIRQFAKRQMTWFRRMERQGVSIKWITV
ncbi:tRNA dimethylallyltransferase 2 [Bacteroidia bacterium]|nr:tRNA dimethylallyltransferase 2 [Bacteroidia bacterium]